MDNSEAENLGIELFVIGIYNAVNNSGIECPLPDMHIYLSGILQRQNDPGYNAFAQSFKTEHPFEYIKKTENFGYLNLPNHIRYFFARVNAENITVEQALAFEEEYDMESVKFAANLYDAARFYRQRYAQHNSETEILKEMAENLPYCIKVLGAFYKEYGDEIPEINKESLTEFYTYVRDYNEFLKLMPHVNSESFF